MSLTQELIGDHQALFALLDEVRDLGIGSPEGRSKLMGAKKLFLAHLAKEDRHLYPKLEQAAKEDRQLETLYSRFASEMDEISRFAVEFFEHPWAESERMEFAKKFGRLYVILHQRMSREESALYPEFDKLARS